MRKLRVKELIFIAICADLGLFSKRMISPFTNIITDALHIPGGIGTSFSLMFLVLSVMLLKKKGVATLMSFIQCVIALSIGMVGSMGALSIIGYMVPGMVIDLLFVLTKKIQLTNMEKCALLNAIGALSAALTANCIVFHLKGIVLALYGSVALFSGLLCGILGDILLRRIQKVIQF
ncbi:MAG: ECF transporter S component [Bacillota bacterium]|nr:ECF transporter S component [Bacillota bacterium]